MNKITGFEDTIRWYNENAEEYASKIESRANEIHLDEFVKTIGEKGRVLDAGCAGGRDCGELKSRGMDVVGVDISSGLIEYAKKHHPDIEFHEGSFLNLPFEDGVFSGVWSRASLLHLETIEEVRQALREFNRVLRVEGILFIFVKQQLGEEKTSVVSDTLSGHERFFRWFNKEEIIGLLEETGFSMVKIEDNLTTDRKELKWILGLAKKTQ